MYDHKEQLPEVALRWTQRKGSLNLNNIELVNDEMQLGWL
jgi:hypothetical protein